MAAHCPNATSYTERGRGSGLVPRSFQGPAGRDSIPEGEGQLTWEAVMIASSRLHRFHFTKKMRTASTSTVKMSESKVVIITGAELSSGVTTAKRLPVGGAKSAIY